MLIASSGTQKRTIYLGLSEENMRRLADDQPIVKDLSEHPGFEDLKIVIMGPEDTIRFCAKTKIPLPPDMR